MNVLLVPTIALDVSLLDRLAASVDYPIKHKVVICGGRVGALDEWKKRWPGWMVYYFESNPGFAGSVNQAPVLYGKEDAWLLMNDDGEFQPGCLERMCRASDEHAKDHHVIYVNEHQSFDICVWTRKGFDEFGSFDENFWPAYYEDYDMRARFSLGNFKPYFMPQPFPVKHGKPCPCGPKYHGMMDALKPLNEDYMMRKWGTLGDKPFLMYPFGNYNNRLQDWTLELGARKRREAICAEFWNQPNPSLYL